MLAQQEESQIPGSLRTEIETNIHKHKRLHNWALLLAKAKYLHPACYWLSEMQNGVWIQLF